MGSNNVRYRLVVSLPSDLLEKLKDLQSKIQEKRRVKRYPMSLVVEQLLRLGFNAYREKIGEKEEFSKNHF